ncbi:hypothetical protein M413DRAFT_198082 [Hebeloma cylindrosporum]|uniref:Uncharacterized protein n=1 Tax=Hebeloma cylindrosporum TaxID=76867 RepID=A0A0C2XNX4_HEBCY|nr:hypothetical protein M413DRAFT_198082 [Hebeloma cylindrosporum h7]
MIDTRHIIEDTGDGFPSLYRYCRPFSCSNFLAFFFSLQVVSPWVFNCAFTYRYGFLFCHNFFPWVSCWFHIAVPHLIFPPPVPALSLMSAPSALAKRPPDPPRPRFGTSVPHRGSSRSCRGRRGSPRSTLLARHNRFFMHFFSFCCYLVFRSSRLGCSSLFFCLYFFFFLG